VDINMGCPDKSIEKQGCGAGMIKAPQKAAAVVAAAKRARDDFSKDVNFAVTVKTRVGYNKEDIDNWITFLLSLDIDALTIHARTRKEMSKVPANWDYVKKVVDIRDALGKETAIFGNGDVQNIEDGYNKSEATGANGVMVGRALFGNPWFFKNIHDKTLGDYMATKNERVITLLDHVKLFEHYLSDVKSFAIMKKFFKTYLSGFDDAKPLRDELMAFETSTEVKERLQKEII